MRFWGLSWSFVFVLFAVVQLNDPDPLVWTSFYLLSALAHFLHFLKKYRSWLHLGLMIIALIWSIIYLPEMLEWLSDHEFSDLAKSMKAEEAYIEGSREYLGLMIVFLSLLLPWYKLRRTKATSPLR